MLRKVARWIDCTLAHQRALCLDRRTHGAGERRELVSMSSGSGTLLCFGIQIVTASVWRSCMCHRPMKRIPALNT